MSQRPLAAAASVPLSTIARIENRLTSPPLRRPVEHARSKRPPPHQPNSRDADEALGRDRTFPRRDRFGRRPTRAVHRSGGPARPQIPTTPRYPHGWTERRGVVGDVVPP